MEGNESGVTAPTKACPHCGAQAQTLEKKCPACGKGYKKRTALKVVLSLLVLGIVGIGGCTALFASGVEEAADNFEEEQAAHAITPAQFREISIGMTLREVREVTGKPPRDRQDLESEGLLGDEPQRTRCIYYNKADGEFLDSYQVCFDDGRLTSKNDW